MRYRINSPKVIHQIFETEVVIVNLETGNYYSVGGSGIEIWRSLDQGGIVLKADSSDPARHKIQNFLDELEREQLIQREDQSVEASAAEPEPAPDWKSPTLEKFTDMREMLLIDPIHELDEGGWPQPVPPNEPK